MKRLAIIPLFALVLASCEDVTQVDPAEPHGPQLAYGEPGPPDDPGPPDSPGQPPWLSKIAFARYLGPYSSPVGIFVMKADGSDVAQVTDNTWRDYAPSWSPDGTQIVFESSRDDPLNNTEIYIMDADGSNPTRLTFYDGWDHRPKWSPDGTEILFFRDVSLDPSTMDYRILAINTDGTGLRELGPGEWPDWSPRGERIVYTLCVGPWGERQCDIYVMNADGTDAAPLTETPDNNEVAPAWSPDGRKIAFIAYSPGVSDIYVMNADGSDPYQVTNTPNKVGHADWSPDSKKLVFTYGFRTADVYVINIDGSGMTNVTNTDARELDAAWGGLIRGRP